MLSDDCRFHLEAILIQLIQLDYISGAVSRVEQTEKWGCDHSDVMYI